MSNTKNLANLASVLDDGTNGQVLQSTGSGGVAFADAGGTGVTVHDNQAAMLTDAVSAAEGTLHYDTNSNILYVKKASAGSSGFFLLASITNVTPQINTFTEATGGAGANNLSNAGSFALTAGSNSDITINATDDNLDTLTYSATVTSGTATNVISSPSFPVTNQSSNVFTLTPATSGGGSITIRFDVSDSTSIDSVTQTFSIQFSIADSRFTRLLMATDNAIGNNQSITDSSSSGHTITASGDAHAGTFSPHKASGYSTHFNGSTDYLTIPDNAEHEFDGDFSIEFFWKPETVTGNTQNIHIALSCGNDTSTQFIYHESNYWYLQKGSGGAQALSSSGQGSAASAGQWRHVVLCRSGTTLSIFHDGTRTATNSSYTATVDFSGSTIGRYYASSANYYMDGLLRDMRWLKGSSAYDATQSSITVPTEALTAITNTKLLLFHTPYLADGSSTGHTVTLYGAINTRPSSPYDNSNEYSEATDGGSISFDGSDHLSIADSTDFTVGSNSFTAECWVYPTTSPSQPLIFGQWSNPYSWAIQFSANSARNLRLIFHDGGFKDNNSTAVIGLNQWSHVALVKSGTSVKGYINGSEVLTATVGTLTDSSSAITVGGQTGGGQPFTGNIAEARLVIGTAVYSGEFTPPSGPLTTTGGTYPSTTNVNTSITSGHTKLLIKGTDAHVLDKSQVNNLKLYGNAVSTSALSSSSTPPRIGANWDATSAITLLQSSSQDHIFAEEFDLSSNAFTIETWVYLTDATGERCLVDFRPNGSSSGDYFNLNFNAGVPKLQTPTLTSSVTLSANTWYHLAVTKDTSSSTHVLRMYVDGTKVAQTNDNRTWLTGTNRPAIGGIGYNQSNLSAYFFRGYIQDFRISLGLARYTADNETSNIPSTPLAG